MKEKHLGNTTDERHKIIYHGSSIIIEKPRFGEGNSRNDYGKGFYCTQSIDLAKEWACTNDKFDGFANKYIVDIDQLNILNLSTSEYNILNWLAILLNNRTFKISNQITLSAKEYIDREFLPDYTKYDAIIGYRADDSYFSFAEDFINNTISLRQLEKAMHLGNLGEQFVLKSKKAFEQIEFIESETADKGIYFLKRMARDRAARDEYLRKERYASILDDFYMIDILREGMKNNDPRLQRNIFE